MAPAPLGWFREADVNDFPLRGFSFPSTATYTVVEELGRGGMGVVYLVEKNCGGVLDYVVFKSFKTLDDEQEARLRNEANIATFLRHENIVKTYGLESVKLADLPEEFRRSLGVGTQMRPTSDLQLPTFSLRRLVDPRKGNKRTPGFAPARMPNPLAKPQGEQDQRVMFMSMDYVDGVDLAMLMRHHFKLHLLLPSPIAMFVVSRIARALEYAHQWIVHKDVTPGNMLISSEGVPKLADFGIAAPVAAAGEEFAGKVHYMAPEQLARQKVDGRADIFSLGVVAYELLTGVNLFKPLSRGSWDENVRWVRQSQSRPILAPHVVCPDIPERLSQLVMKMLEYDPERRYQRMTEVCIDLEKRYLFAQGFGPTNNSMSAYLRIFEGDFVNANQDDLRQLTFLRNKEGKVALQRRISRSLYSEAGLNLVKERKKSPIYNVVARQEAGTVQNPTPQFNYPAGPAAVAGGSVIIENPAK
ncbi:MAG: serine/threonine protein kinase [Planctomycetes bacterium]|nr:serine/threonine protein kinase [Planctomycetota bacterium]